MSTKHPFKSIGLLQSMLLLMLIIFGIWLLNDQGLLSIVMEGDKSHISKVIGLLWIISTLYWLFLSNEISKERDSFNIGSFKNNKLSISKYFIALEKGEDKDILLKAFEAEYTKKLSYGWMAADISLKLGLLGTIIGFILMLQPIAELNDTSSDSLKLALSGMSSGMAVALYTTLTGLIVSTITRSQFHILSVRISSLINDVTFYLDINLE